MSLTPAKRTSHSLYEFHDCFILKVRAKIKFKRQAVLCALQLHLDLDEHGLVFSRQSTQSNLTIRIPRRG